MSDASGCCSGAGIAERRRPISFSADLPKPFLMASTARNWIALKPCSIVPIPTYSTGLLAVSHHQRQYDHDVMCMLRAFCGHKEPRRTAMKAQEQELP